VPLLLPATAAAAHRIDGRRCELRLLLHLVLGNGATRKALVAPTLTRKSWRRTRLPTRCGIWWRQRRHLQPRCAVLYAVDDILQGAPRNAPEEDAPIFVPAVPPANEAGGDVHLDVMLRLELATHRTIAIV
jgi:hypothetical protein